MQSCVFQGESSSEYEPPTPQKDTDTSCDGKFSWFIQSEIKPVATGKLKETLLISIEP